MNLLHLIFGATRVKRWKRERHVKRMNRIIGREVKYFSKIIVESAARLDIEHWKRKDARPPNLIWALITGERSRETLQFLRILFSEQALYFEIDVQQLPHSVNLGMLEDEMFLRTISAACRRVIRFKWGVRQGAWFILEREGAVHGIPTLFKFKEAINLIPKTARSPFTFVVGVGENNKIIMRDLAEMPHMFVAGATGQGKSVMVKNVLTTIMWRDPYAKRTAWYLIDLKAGMEFLPYKKLPHISQFITEPDEVPDMLAELEAEVIRRSKMFADHGVLDLRGWNRLHPDRKLPALLLAIDELAQVLKHPDKKLTERTTLALGRILQIGRAAGVSALISTQRPGSDVIEGWLKTNVDVRMAFRLPSPNDSRVVINRGDAARLSQKGRAIFAQGADFYEVQAPLISPHQVKQAVARVLAKNELAQPEHAEVTLDEVLTYSLANFNGSLARLPLYDAFKGRGLSEDKLYKMLRALDDQIVAVEGQEYRVINGGRLKGRYMELTKQNGHIEDLSEAVV